jgi:hypothetical protein
MILTLLFYVIVAGIPAYFMNKYLLAWLQPKKSVKNFVMYVLAAFSVAIIYTFLFSVVLIKFVFIH